MIDYKILIQTISLDSLSSMLTFIPQENKETMNRKLDEVMEKMLASGYFEKCHACQVQIPVLEAAWISLKHPILFATKGSLVCHLHYAATFFQTLPIIQHLNQ